MQVIKAVIPLARLLMIGWASVWITALPLFHTHLSGILQQPVGVAHTVFSRDLPGEFWAFNHKSRPNECDLWRLASSSPELGFVASLQEDGNRKPWKLGDLSSPLRIQPPALLDSEPIQRRPTIKRTSWSPCNHGLRAPPQPLSS